MSERSADFSAIEHVKENIQPRKGGHDVGKLVSAIRLQEEARISESARTYRVLLISSPF
jgi:hypothetical protein